MIKFDLLIGKYVRLSEKSAWNGLELTDALAEYSAGLESCNFQDGIKGQDNKLLKYKYLESGQVCFVILSKITSNQREL